MVRAMLLGATIAVLTAAGTAQAAPQPPAVDPFYAPPAELADTPPGAIIRSREVNVQIGPVSLSSTFGKGYQLAFRTNDAHDRPLVGVTTIVVPTKIAKPAGGRSLVSLQDAEDSVDLDCAPSYQLQIGSPDSANLVIESTILSSVLVQGQVMMIPDHEGPRSEYIVTGMEGHAVLDAIRAATKFDKAELRGVTTPVALVGYSGGAHATAAANELHPGYAPELNLVAVAAGGVPVGTMENVEYLDGSLGTGALMALAIAMDREYPEIGLEALLNDKGKAFHKQASEGCATAILAAPFARMDGWTKQPGAFRLPHVAKVIDDNALGKATPTAPTFYYNAIGDELVTIKPLDKLVAKYCAEGATLQYFRDPAGLEHIQALATFGPLALAYIEARLAGMPAPNSCPPGGKRPPAAAGPQAQPPTSKTCRRRSHAAPPRPGPTRRPPHQRPRRRQAHAHAAPAPQEHHPHAQRPHPRHRRAAHHRPPRRQIGHRPRPPPLPRLPLLNLALLRVAADDVLHRDRLARQPTDDGEHLIGQLPTVLRRGRRRRDVDDDLVGIDRAQRDVRRAARRRLDPLLQQPLYV